ncbi:MAG: PIN domain-containing protein [Phototrophicaceae bacterium]|jgi:predicted nucleic acid-binding protein
MTVAIVDTTVVIHYFRKNPAARVWVDKQPFRLSLTSMTWLEAMHGAGSRIHQETTASVLDQFHLLYFTDADQQWAMKQVERYRLSHGIGIHDCLIAAVAYRLGVPLYTHNLKDMTVLIGIQAEKPY